MARHLVLDDEAIVVFVAFPGDRLQGFGGRRFRQNTGHVKPQSLGGEVRLEREIAFQFLFRSRLNVPDLNGSNTLVVFSPI